jgi:hypothetical protein
MGGKFKADTDQLGQFVRSLEGCVRDLNEARSALSHVRADQIGTSELDEACDGFQERWKYGAEQTKEMIDAISEGVKVSKKNYQEVEDALEKTLKAIEQKSTSAGNDGG